MPLDYSDYTVKQSGYLHLPLSKKIEYLAREISKKQGYELLTAKDDILALQKVNESLRIKADDYDFALELFNVEFPDRLGWLLRKINDSDVSDTIKDELYDALTRGGIIE